MLSRFASAPARKPLMATAKRGTTPRNCSAIAVGFVCAPSRDAELINHYKMQGQSPAPPPPLVCSRAVLRTAPPVVRLTRNRWRSNGRHYSGGFAARGIKWQGSTNLSVKLCWKEKGCQALPNRLDSLSLFKRRINTKVGCRGLLLCPLPSELRCCPLHSVPLSPVFVTVAVATFARRGSACAARPPSVRSFLCYN